LDARGQPLPEWLVWEALYVISFFAVSFCLGRLVQRRRWNANYTRKLLGLAMLATPFAIGFGQNYGANRLSVTASFIFFGMSLLLFIKPMRSRSAFLTTAFAAIDRPEDRPHTLTWFATSYVVSSIILLATTWGVVSPSPYPAYAAITFYTVAIGDLLAGSVGYHFGKHRYQTTALFTSKTYTRSLEGSACVFLVTLLGVLAIGQMLPYAQFIAALIVMPIMLTLAEAKSPHTWDEPAMFLAGMMSALAIDKLVWA
jgi:dolichol kinase